MKVNDHYVVKVKVKVSINHKSEKAAWESSDKKNVSTSEGTKFEQMHFSLLNSK